MPHNAPELRRSSGVTQPLPEGATGGVTVHNYITILKYIEYGLYSDIHRGSYVSILGFTP